MDYRNKAINCVKNTILPIQRKQFEECGCCLDEQYKRYGNTERLFANTIEDGHVYEIGYPVCVCPDVASGKAKDVSQFKVHDIYFLPFPYISANTPPCLLCLPSLQKHVWLLWAESVPL